MALSSPQVRNPRPCAMMSPPWQRLPPGGCRGGRRGKAMVRWPPRMRGAFASICEICGQKFLACCVGAMAMATPSRGRGTRATMGGLIPTTTVLAPWSSRLQRTRATRPCTPRMARGGAIAFDLGGSPVLCGPRHEVNRQDAEAPSRAGRGLAPLRLGGSIARRTRTLQRSGCRWSAPGRCGAAIRSLTALRRSGDVGPFPLGAGE